jgi:hypothetical protein
MSEMQRLNQLKDVGFQTGSVRLGCDNPQDEDWVILMSDWKDIIGTELGDFYYLPHKYSDNEFQCFFLDYKGTKYNFIIPFNDKDFFITMRATKIMLNFPVKYIQNKSARIDMFEDIKSLLRGELDSPIKCEYNELPSDENDVPY